MRLAYVYLLLARHQVQRRMILPEGLSARLTFRSDFQVTLDLPWDCYMLQPAEEPVHDRSRCAT